MCITAAVGLNQKNAADDVEIIVRLLNFWLGSTGKQKLDVTRRLNDKVLNQLGLFIQTESAGSAVGVLSKQGGVTFKPFNALPLVIQPSDQWIIKLASYIPLVWSPSDLTEEHLGIIFSEASGKALHRYILPIRVAMEKYEINSQVRMIHFLAQTGHESARLMKTKELYNGDPDTFFLKYESGKKGKELGNEVGDGAKFRGRGLIQITGKANYKQFENDVNTDKKSKVDYTSDVNRADAIANDENLCCQVAGWFWKTRKLNHLADKDDIIGITKKINGGTNGLEDRKMLLKRARYVISGIV